jgi:hypothetical protein
VSCCSPVSQFHRYHKFRRLVHSGQHSSFHQIALNNYTIFTNYEDTLSLVHETYRPTKEKAV